MNNVAKKISDLSIWNSVVNDKIIQLEELEKKYWSRGRKMETLAEENEILKADKEEITAQLTSVKAELNGKDAQIRILNREVRNLKQWIENMENSTCWKVTKPIRVLMGKIRRY